MIFRPKVLAHFKGGLDVAVQEMHSLTNIDADLTEIDRVVILHLDDGVIRNRWDIIAVCITIKDTAHVGVENDVIQVDLLNLDIHQLRIKKQSILFIEFFKNNWCGVVGRINHKRHVDELVLQNFATIRQLKIPHPTGFWSGDHLDGC
ncbi:hypothetical protein D3C86_1443020 [compost metagenome]